MKNNRSETNKKIKCLVWDLDNTLWSGTLLEDENVQLNEQAVQTIKALDERGVLQSISSKNNHDHAFEKLKEFGLDQYFLYPQINWNRKSESIERIAEMLNLGIDTFAFIDDQDFELEEVQHSHPSVFCMKNTTVGQILNMDQFMPRFITSESKWRRSMYKTDIDRKQKEEHWVGPKEDFLADLNMRLVLRETEEGDLERAEELTVRTNQLNATGYTYTYDELKELSTSKDHLLITSVLEDKYGTYGIIGFTLLECFEDKWNIKLLLMSCRVISRGVGSVVLNVLKKMAKDKGLELFGEFIETDRNRMMYLTYKFSNFSEYKIGCEKSSCQNCNKVKFKCDLSQEISFPDYVNITWNGIPVEQSLIAQESI